MIRFDFMCPHTVNGPVTRGEPERYVMFRCEPSLPIQDDGRLVTAWTNETHVEKCLWSQIRTRDTDRIGRTRDNRTVHLEVLNDGRRFQHGRNIEFGAIRVRSTAPTGVATGDQNSSVHEQCGLVKHTG